MQGKDRIDNLQPDQYLNRYVINQTALKETGWDKNEVLNKTIDIRHGNMKQGPVIGVVRDFNFQSLHYPMRPLVMEFVPNNYSYMLVRYQGNDVKKIINHIQSAWKKSAGEIPFEYSFLDQNYERLYKSEMEVGKLFTGFAGVSVLIAILGLFGLASYAANKRTREIGIRKVFGASVINILSMLTRDFIWLVS